MSEFVIAKESDENWVLSKDGAKIFVAGNDGTLRIYDAQTGVLLDSVSIGVDLEAITISPDGTKLAITEGVIRDFFDSPTSEFNDTAKVDFYVVDIATLSSQRFTHDATGIERAFADIAFVTDSIIHLTQNVDEQASARAPLHTFDLDTETFLESGNFYSGLGKAPSLTTVPDTEAVLLGELGIWPPPYALVDDSGNIFASRSGYDNDVIGFADGIEAVSGTGLGERIAFFSNDDLHLYRGTFDYAANLTDLAGGLEGAAGLTFFGDRDELWVLDDANDRIVRIDSSRYIVNAIVELSEFNAAVLQWGEELVVAEGGNTVYLNTSDGLYVQSIARTITGTENNDSLIGTASDDIIDALGGDDFISGSAGADLIIGGDGRDTLLFRLGDFSDIPAPSVPASYVLTDSQFTDSSGLIDTELSGIESFIFSNFSSVGTTLDASAWQPADGGPNPILIISQIGSNAFVTGSDFDDSVQARGSNLTFDLGGGFNRLSLEVTDFTVPIVIGTLGEWGSVQQATGNSATEFDIAFRDVDFLSVFANRGLPTDVLVDARAAPTRIQFADGIGSDRFIGGAFDDFFSHDERHSNTDADTYTGKDGFDTYRFGRQLQQLDNTTITDFAPGDVIELTTYAGYAVQLSSFIGDEQFSGIAGEIRYEKANGETLVQYDGDGDGIADGTLTLSNGEFDLKIFDRSYGALNLAVIVYFEGTAGDDNLIGTAGDDTLRALSGNDILDGGEGADIMVGNSGDDTYYIDNSGDVVVELEDEGFDSIFSLVNLNANAQGLLNVENFTLQGDALEIYANDFDNVLTASFEIASKLFGNGGDDELIGGLLGDKLFGGAGADLVRGLGGDDRLDGGIGADVLIGGLGNDTYIVDNLGDLVVERPDSGIDVVRSSVNWTLGDHVENLRLQAGASIGVGNALDNRMSTEVAAKLEGLDGNDTLRGSLFADTLFGGRGDDALKGRDGNDDLRGAAGNDNLRGGEGNDFLRGGSGEDRMLGDSGDDFIDGGRDMDIVTGGLGADTFIFNDRDFAGVDELTADRITDFDAGDGDIIDLSGVDSILGGSDDAFTFIADAAFTNTAGELRWEVEGSNTMIYMDVNGDGVADYAIRLDGALNLAEANFLL